MSSRGAATASADRLTSSSDYQARAMVANVHPALWIVIWCVFAILAQRLELGWLATVAAPVGALVVYHAPQETLRLLKKARWLLLAIVVMFAVATPGERIPCALGALGVTYDGLHLAAEHLLRLVMLLGTLASLFRQLGRGGLLSGLYFLLRPIGGWRERLVVRLMLALEYAEKEGSDKRWRDWLSEVPGNGPGEGPGEGPQSVRLAIVPMRLGDRIAFGLLLALATAGLLL